ncbi:unnamed protein product [Allacma fusca]|uniref:Uncharacterized protein n=1 Tax=Allacma fusca TaxID=39272 RepID=A0A8J2PBK3_9HEXA|nr:unnamed protein product [Allacma fusca]
MTSPTSNIIIPNPTFTLVSLSLIPMYTDTQKPSHKLKSKASLKATLLQATFNSVNRTFQPENFFSKVYPNH